MLQVSKFNLLVVSVIFFCVYAFVCIAVGDYIFIGKGQFYLPQDGEFFFGLMTLGMLVTAFVCRRLLVYPTDLRLGLIIGATIIMLMIISVILLLGRFYYSRTFILYMGVVTVIGVYVWSLLILNYGKIVVGYLPFGSVEAAIQVAARQKNVTFVKLDPTNYNLKDFDAVMADLHAELPIEWYRLLAECVLAKKKVGHSATLYEMMSGRIMLSHISELQLEDFSPSTTYRTIKRLFDLAFAIVLLPLFLIIIGLAVILIKTSSKGSAFFTQPRVGEGGKLFTIYKLRTMKQVEETQQALFADVNDPRITRVGRFLRKFRIDELPQIFNIIRGDMSWIGPRPEQKEFVDEYEKEIRFYGYRHLLKPGITGWAQVMHGYAADLSATQEKLVYDFFYIKHASIWLDILIIYRTMITVFTGFGSR